MKGKQNILDFICTEFKDKKFLFLENDWDLYRELKVIEDCLIENKIKYHTIFNIDKVSVKGILEVVDFADVIIWQSTYVSEKSRDLLKMINNYKDKVFVEVQLNEPMAFFKGSLIPDVYILNGFDDDDFDNMWTFHKLSEKPLWEKDINEI